MPRPSDDPVRQARVSRRLTLAAVRLVGRQAHYAKKLLCDGEGKLTPDAEMLIGLLATEARLNKHGFVSDGERRLFDAGAQHIVRLLIDWTQMDTGRLARVQQQLHDEMKG